MMSSESRLAPFGIMLYRLIDFDKSERAPIASRRPVYWCGT